MRLLVVIWCLRGIVHGSIKVKTVETQEAAVGGNVTLRCQLITSYPHIFQITWQKESGNFTGPVATYSKKYGEKLIGYYFQRTEQFTVDTLNASAITINPVTLEDQGCFTCIFNVYPFGANSGKTCLDVYETNILDPSLEIAQIASGNTSEKQHIVTCSATGQPTPEITWKLPDHLGITPETYTIVNSNRTVTVISNFTQSSSRTLDVTEVICVVRHPALCPEKRLSALIDDTRDKGSSASTADLSIPIAITCTLCVIILVMIGIFICRRLRKPKLPDFEKNGNMSENLQQPNATTLLKCHCDSDLCKERTSG
ncbi:OX-2 membrane glycoprotein-like isoform X2 [Pseudophryne corroboree]|uniref:OX-2 membrane glycoprotein-like isoform X2 n=1 Tax=Pseudophryne corroboree TaxID=495146 RepID=UPI0030812F32